MQTALDVAILRAKCARQTPQAVMERPKPPVIIDVVEHVESAPIKIVVVPPTPWVDDKTRHPVSRIIKAACHHFGLSYAVLCGPERYSQFVYARQVAMYVSHRVGISHPNIGRRFGGRDHTTSLSSYRKIERLQCDPHVAADCEDLARAIGEVI